ncbi:MAG: TonB-dependent receptor [Sphingobacteriales bacterium]|nr:MAG: TonB-dependent receptor [Sphingobacteriales bacterium]
MWKVVVLAIFILSLTIDSQAQRIITGRVTDGTAGVTGAILLDGKKPLGASDTSGSFSITLPDSSATILSIRATGFALALVPLAGTDSSVGTIVLKEDSRELTEVVVTGTMKEVSRMDSPIPVEIITPKFFQKNPSPSLFESVGMLNGVKPQLNCNVCNTGDIHINGMEGPYTLVLIDGMPIVSALSSVYGLSGIPNSLVERIEVVKGPASSLYGSEAMGGIINVITRNPAKAAPLSIDLFGTSWQEYNADLGLRLSSGRHSNLLGINYFNYQDPVDRNKDGFTDVTLQHRVSLFNKWSLLPSMSHGGGGVSLAGRLVYEDRWGGQMNWNRNFRGTDSVYGESIYTKRVELIGRYQLPVKEKVVTQFSYNWHEQNSFYGTVPYMANQHVAFAQTYWNKSLRGDHDLLAGAAFRFVQYDDNTPATMAPDGVTNKPAITALPGVFLQDEWKISKEHMLLAGYRFDYDRNHGPIHSPRFAYKWAPDAENVLRMSFGTGFRVVNLFTEDHAALTGSREVVIAEALRPERSYNSNLNYIHRLATPDFFINFDLTAFYAHFSNRIVADYMSSSDKIIYDNLKGYAVSRGVSLNLDAGFTIPLKIMAGVSYMDVFQDETIDGIRKKERQLFAPEWSGNMVVGYTFPKGWSADFTGNWYGPMRLPVLPNDYRPEYSPTYAILNLQVTRKIGTGLEIYGGVKNLLDFVPKDPIMRPQDPFDKQANDPLTNPNGYTFDPSYNYAPLQGARGFLGVRFHLIDR